MLRFEEMTTWDEPEQGIVVYDVTTDTSYEVGGKYSWYRWLRQIGGDEHRIVETKDAIDHTRWREQVPVGVD